MSPAIAHQKHQPNQNLSMHEYATWLILNHINSQGRVSASDLAIFLIENEDQIYLPSGIDMFSYIDLLTLDGTLVNQLLEKKETYELGEPGKILLANLQR